MADPYQKAMARGCLGSVVWQIVAFAAAALFVCLFLVATLAGRSLPVEPWLQSAIAGSAILLCLFGLVVATFAFTLRRARVLDPAFARLSIPGRVLGANGRQYHGSVRGRRLDAIYFRGARGSLGPQLTLHVECRVMTKLAVGTRTSAGAFLGGLVGLSELSLPDPAYSKLIASSADPSFGPSFFLDPRVKPLLLGLIVDPRDHEMRSFSLRPGVASLTRRFFDPELLFGDELVKAVDALVALADLAEARPAPTVTAEPDAFERRLRERPGGAGCLIAGVLVAVAVVLGTAAVAAIVFLDSSSQSAPVKTKPGPGRRR